MLAPGTGPVIKVASRIILGGDKAQNHAGWLVQQFHTHHVLVDISDLSQESAQVGLQRPRHWPTISTYTAPGFVRKALLTAVSNSSATNGFCRNSTVPNSLSAGSMISA